MTITDAQRVEILRGLHTPVLCGYAVECEHCESYGDAHLSWPCRTAVVLYTSSELADWDLFFSGQIAQRVIAQAERLAARRAEIATGSPPTLSEKVAEIYGPVLRAQLQDSFCGTLSLSGESIINGEVISIPAARIRIGGFTPQHPPEPPA